MTPNTMTLDEVRDELARRDGWNTYNEGVPDDGARHVSWWRYTLDAVHGGRTWCKSHPHPATLDGAAAALPKGWVWRQIVRNNPVGWMCSAAMVSEFCRLGEWIEHRAIARSEISARYRLALACRIAEEGK